MNPKTCALIALATGLVLAGGSVSRAADDDKPESIPLKATNSNMVVLLPKDFKPEQKWPLVILLHGNGNRAENYLRVWDVEPVRKTFIVAAINAKNRLNWDRGNFKAVVEAINTLTPKYNVDPQNIWLNGFSGGGCSALAWGIQKHEKFRGAVIFANGLQGDNWKESELAAGKNLAVYIACGDRDPHLKALARPTYEKLNAIPYPTLKFVEIKDLPHTVTRKEVTDACEWMVEIMAKQPEKAAPPK